MTTIFSARYAMTADIQKQGYPQTNGNGTVSYHQDPDSGAIIRSWVDDPTTTAIEGTTVTTDCQIQSIVATGIRGNATVTSYFGGEYKDVNIVRANFPASTVITNKDRVTNVRLKKTNTVLYSEDGKPLVFNVIGVSPNLDPFGQLIEWEILMERAQVQ